MANAGLLRGSTSARASKETARAEEQSFVDHVYRTVRARLAALDIDTRQVAGNAQAQRALWTNAQRQRADLEAAAASSIVFGRLTRDAPQDGFTDDIHIGRHSVREGSGGDVLCVHWTARAADPFFQASPADPMTYWRRRRIDTNGRQVHGVTDELLVAPSTASTTTAITGEHAPRTNASPSPVAKPATEPVLTRHLARQRDGVMRDVLETIERAQWDAVTAGIDRVLVVQGGPGTGKTAVGLPRAARLLHRHEDLRKRGVLVVGPNPLYLQYIRQVLPTLDAGDVAQAPITSICGVDVGEVKTEELPTLAALKGSDRLALVLERALLQPRKGSKGVRIRLRSNAKLVAEVTSTEVHRLASSSARSSRTLSDSVSSLTRRLVETLQDRLRTVAEEEGIALLSKNLDPLHSAEAVKTAARAAFRDGAATDVLAELLADPDSLLQAAQGVLTDDEVTSLLRDADAAWTVSDLPLIDEVHALLGSSVTRYGYLVVDEAQDLSEMQARTLARRCPKKRVTLLGDLAQATSPGAISSWTQLAARFGGGDVSDDVRALTTGYRVPAPVLDFAWPVVSSVAQSGTTRPTSLLDGTTPVTIHVATTALGRRLNDRVDQLAAGGASVGVVVSDITVDETLRLLRSSAATGRSKPTPVDARAAPLGTGVAVVPASMVKGLEFDHVIVLEPEDIVSQMRTDDGAGLRLLYVALTRCTKTLTVLHARPLPDELSAASAPVKSPPTSRCNSPRATPTAPSVRRTRVAAPPVKSPQAPKPRTVVPGAAIDALREVLELLTMTPDAQVDKELLLKATNLCLKVSAQLEAQTSAWDKISPRKP